MTLEVSVDKFKVDSIVKKLEKMKRKVTSRVILNTIMLEIKNNILLRTLGGKDVNYKSFEPYSPFYAAKEGKTVVNLMQSGLMLNSMTQKALSNTMGVVFFSNKTARERALKHNTGAGVPIREFFGVNRDDEKKALKTYENKIKKVKREVNL